MLDHPVAAYLLTASLLAGIYLMLRFFGGFHDRELFGMFESIVVALVVTLGTSAFLQSFFLQRQTFGIRRWLGFGPKPVWIIPTYLDASYLSRVPGMPYYVVPPFDAQSAGIIAQVLASAGIHYPRRKVMGSHRYLREVLEDNLILLCLPERNQYSRIFLGLYNEIYAEGKDVQAVIQPANIQSYVDDVNCQKQYFGAKCLPVTGGNEWQMKHFGMPPGREWWQSSINLNPRTNIHVQGATIYDYAMIVKGPNPINPAASVLIICGIHGIGTLGGALWVYEHANELFRDYPAPAQTHLIQICYTPRQGANNYVDSDILEIKQLYYMELHPRP